MDISVERFQELSRKSTVLGDSLAASFFGYLAGSLTMAAFHLPALQHFVPGWFGGGLFLWELIVSLFFSFVGWLVYILPVAFSVRPGRWTNHMWLVVPLGGIAGSAMLVPFHPWFTEPDRHVDPVWLLFQLSALINAATASCLCVMFRRRSLARIQTTGQDQG